MSNNVLVRDLMNVPPYLRAVLDHPTQVRAISGTVDFSDDGTAVVIGRIPVDAWVLGVFVNVVTAFDSTGTDLLDVGTNTDPDGFANDIDVSSTGIQYACDGALIGQISTADQVELLYSQSIADATAGEAHVVVLYLAT